MKTKKLTRMVLLICFITFIFSINAVSGLTNVISNGGFETGSDIIAENWSEVRGASGEPYFLRLYRIYEATLGWVAYIRAENGWVWGQQTINYPISDFEVSYSLQFDYVYHSASSNGGGYMGIEIKGHVDGYYYYLTIYARGENVPDKIDTTHDKYYKFSSSMTPENTEQHFSGDLKAIWLQKGFPSSASVIQISVFGQGVYIDPTVYWTESYFDNVILYRGSAGGGGGGGPPEFDP